MKQRSMNANGSLTSNGKKITDIAKNHTQYKIEFDTFLQECKGIEDYIKMRLDEEESKLWKKFSNNYPKALTNKDIGIYIASEPSLIAMKTIHMEVVDTRRKLEAVVDALKDMSWLVGNMTKLFVAQIEDATL
jgi:hypothetical protein